MSTPRQPKPTESRALGVIRLSVETDESTSPERQRESIEAWSRMQGVPLVGVAEDIGVSGTVAPEDRGQLGKWFRSPAAGTWNTLVAMKIDRLSRDLEHFVGLTKRYRVVSTSEGVDTGTPVGKLVAQILGMFAEFERERIAERVRDSMDYLRRVGRWRGGWAWYGYRAVQVSEAEGYVLVQDPDAAEVIKEIANRLIAGEAKRAVMYDLNTRGVLTPRDRQRVLAGRPPEGKRWGVSTIDKLMRSVHVLGQDDYQGTVVRGDDGMPVQYGEPILTMTKQAQVLAALDARATSPTRTRQTGYLLDIAFCGNCSGKLYYKDWKVSESRYRYYMCRNRDDCGEKRLSAEHLEDFITRAFLDMVGHLEEIEHVPVPAEDHTEELTRARSNLQGIRGEYDRGEYDYPGGDEDYEQRRQSLVALVKRLSALPRSEARVESVRTGKTYRQQWNAADKTGRRALLLRSGIKLYATREPDDINFVHYRFGVPDDLQARMAAGGVPPAGDLRFTPGTWAWDVSKVHIDDTREE